MLMQTQLLKVKVLEEGLVDHEVLGATVGASIVGCDVHTNPSLGFDRGCTNVRCTVEVLHLREKLVEVNRLMFEHVKSSRCERTRFGLGERRLHDGYLLVRS